jgi:hypothetical protein
VTVVNGNNGITVGAASIQIPSNASKQFVLTPAGGSNSIFSQAGVAVSSGANYALYIQNADTLAGYAHVSYNAGTTLFENNSMCTTPLNRQMYSYNSRVLTNLHTSALAAYPSIVSLHNYSGALTNLTIAAYDAATGTTIGQFNQAISANSTLTLPVTQIQTQLDFSPTSAQQHINLIITNAAGGLVPIELSHTIRNAHLGGNIDMSVACAVNAPAPTVIQVAPSVPTGYCGTMQFSFPYTYLPALGYTMTVTTNGRLEGTLYGENSSYVAGGAFTGSVSGTSFSAVTSDGSTATGTIQNGSITGTFSSSTGGTGTITGSQNACSS